MQREMRRRRNAKGDEKEEEDKERKKRMERNIKKGRGISCHHTCRHLRHQVGNPKQGLVRHQANLMCRFETKTRIYLYLRYDS